MVTTATKDMMPVLDDLWQLSFGDDAKYTGFVFSTLLNPDKILVHMEGSQPVAMLCMEPMELLSGENRAPALYLYAFCVHPHFRGKGLGLNLLEGYDKFCKKRGYVASILTPATKELFSYYEKNGYKTQFAVRQVRQDGNFLVPTGRSCTLISRSLDNLSAMRDDYFSGSNLYVKWSPSYLHFVTEDAKLRGGNVLLAQVGDQKGYIVYRVEAREVVITEFAVPPDCMDDVLHTLHKRINAKRYKVRLASDYGSADGEMVLPFAMIKWYDKMKIGADRPQAPYLNHVMD